MSVTVTTPVLDEELMDSILKTVVMFSKKTKWKAWGMERLRRQGAALLFHGKSGTGKTTTAKWLAKELKLKLFEINYGMIGSDAPGELARNVYKLFDAAKVVDEHDNPSLVFIDECDTMLLDRSKLGSTALWMLEPINALLARIGEYSGLCIMATNARPEFLDPALERRLLGNFLFPVPRELTRAKLWKTKWPKKAPIQGDIYWEHLAHFVMTGAEIENAIINWISDSLQKDIDPHTDGLYMYLNQNFVQEDAPTLKEFKEWNATK